MVRVKICGITSLGQAQAAARLGADFLGLVFAPSRRQLTLGRARQITEALGRPRPSLVGVFVNQPLAEVDRIAGECDLDYVQLSGDETPEYCRGLSRPFIKALRLREGRGDDALREDMSRFMAEGGQGRTLFLLDTFLPGIYGGSGRSWDWKRAASLARSFPLLVAGGLTPENVAAVVAAVQPWGVDVSSGVESNGVKDVDKIAAFIKAAKGHENAR